MKNNFKLALILGISAIFLSGCTTGAPNQTATQTTIPSTDSAQNNFSLKDALIQGKSLKCTFTTDQGTMTSWIKGKKVRVEGAMFETGSGGNGGMINDGTSVYIWNDQDNQGTKFEIATLPSPQADNDQAQNSQQFKDVEKWADDAQSKYKMDCKEEVVNDSQFIPPANITFQDMSQIINKMKDIQKNLPSINPAQLPPNMR